MNSYLAWLLMLLGAVGCGPALTRVQQPVDVTIKVAIAGKPVNNVTLTLQPMIDGGQSQGPVRNGEFKATVVPGTYTYYIDSGKSEADMAKIPTAYRMGAKERQLEITQSASFEVDMK